MHSPQQSLEEELLRVIGEKFKDIDISTIRAGLIEHPKDETFGDYATSVALKLAKTLGKSPKDAAQEILSVLRLPKEFSKAEIAGMGFINFIYNDNYLFSILTEAMRKGSDFGKQNIGQGKTVLTDSSHPNIAKPMGIHHLLSTVIGDALSRIFAHLGYNVVRDNYLGDWGTQFGKLIYAYRKWGDPVTIEENPIPELLKLYVKFHDEVEKNPELEEEGRREFKKLEQGDADNRKLWKWIVAVSLKEFQKMWDLLDARFDVINGESFYEDKIEPILKLGIEKGVFATGERGALICEFPEEGYSPAVVRKADGATLYHTRDLARIKYWEETWHPALMVNVVDVAQKLYFQQLFVMAKKLGLTSTPNVHVVFGRMSFPDRKMSTRKGNIVLLEDVIDEILTLARKIVEEKNPDLQEKEKEEIARNVGIGALKFAVLHQNRESDVKFTWEKILSLQGDSAPYLQYVHARCAGILRKAGSIQQEGVSQAQFEPAPLESEERNLLRLFVKFPQTVADVLENYQPNCLTRYLVKLASSFNLFYDRHSVLQAPTPKLRNFRLQLVSITATLLKTGFSLLGIAAPDRM